MTPSPAAPAPATPVLGTPARSGRRAYAKTLWGRVALASAMIAILTVVVAFVSLRVYVQSDVRGVLVTELLARQQEVMQLQRERQMLLLAASSLISASPTLRAALDTRGFDGDGAFAGSAAAADAQQATLEREVRKLAADIGRDLLVITDEGGRVLASAGRSATLPRGKALMALPAVASALSTDSTSVDAAFGVLTVGGSLMQVSSVPVLLNGFPVGALVLGDRLDRLLASVNGGSSASVLVERGRILQSSVPALPVGLPWSRPAQATGRPSAVTVGDDELLTAEIPLGRTIEGEPITLHLLQSLSAALRPFENGLRSRFLIGGLLAVVLVALFTASVARRSLRPLNEFVDYLRAGAEQPMLAPYDLPSRTTAVEIQTTANAFNGLLDGMLHKQNQLTRRSVELMVANEVLRTEVRERERAEAALQQSEAQLRQAQKLEALGTLAGGVAHDFNNVLAVIGGMAQVLASELPENSDMRADIETISGASRRATLLVRQLLAFSRKQVLKPQQIDINGIVSSMQPLFPPLLGPTIRLELRLAPELARVTADPTQIEQILLNLVVNARDAMPVGGSIVVETASVVFDAGMAAATEAIDAGPTVRLTVRDTGTGMDEATRRRIFEPFFTTKAVGQGTGLGLATVYGIVRQSGGAIAVDSAPGKGTTFSLYFPVATGELTAQAARVRGLSGGSRGAESVLLVEDELDLRLLNRRVLEHSGYRVFDAADARSAVEVAAAYQREHHAPIDLLLTDVVLPDRSGLTLAEQLRERYPSMRVLFVSGFNDEVIARHGQLADDSAFLEKPVLPDALAHAVRCVLDGVPLESDDR